MIPPREPLRRGRPLDRGDASLRRSTGLTRTQGLAAGSRLGPGRGLTRGGELERGPGPSSRPSPARALASAAWTAVTDAAWESWDRACPLCGRPTLREQVHGHHRLMRSQSGPHSPPNCLPLDAGCHRAVHLAGDRAYVAGWLVRTGGDPAAVPVVAHDGRRWLLDAVGDRRPV